jgi:hypothetical protein
MFAVHCLLILVQNVACLPHLLPAIEHHFHILNISPLPSSRTKVLPTPTMGHTEALTVENKVIVDELMFDWLGLTPEEVSKHSVLFFSDQFTIECLREYLDTQMDAMPMERHSFILPVLSWWHIQWAFQKARSLSL